MIRSMTGFGEASKQVDQVHYQVELRSLNNRYFKAVLRLPEQLSCLEAELESRLRRRMSRGSVTMTVRMRLSDNAAVHRVNDTALLTYLDHLETIRHKVVNRKHATHIDLTALLSLPGVLQPLEDEQSLIQRARAVLDDLLDDVCRQMTAMRDEEGQRIADDLNRQKESIRKMLAAVRSRAGSVVEEYHERLKTRVNELMARAQLQVDQSDLLRELAVFAERSDISEELCRLEGHLEQMEQVIGRANGEPVGRTLDFLAQELLREANTIGSKSNDAAISRNIVEIKGAIDRIKEQVQNVE